MVSIVLIPFQATADGGGGGNGACVGEQSTCSTTDLPPSPTLWILVGKRAARVGTRREVLGMWGEKKPCLKKDHASESCDCLPCLLFQLLYKKKDHSFLTSRFASPSNCDKALSSHS